MVCRRFILNILVSLIFFQTTVNGCCNSNCETEKKECKCVQFYLCKNDTNGDKFIIEDGSSVLEARTGGLCSGDEVPCCKLKARTPCPLCQAQCGKRKPAFIDARITGSTTNFGEFPWMIALFRMVVNNTYCEEPKYLSGGALIHRNIVLTTAHSVISVKNNASLGLIARAGAWDLQNVNEAEKLQNRVVAEIIIHPRFNPANLWNDFAILRLDNPFILADHISTICLPPPGKIISRGNCVVTGWGKEKYADPNYKPSVLKSIDLQVVSRTDCTSQFRRTRAGPDFILHESFICAGGIEGVDTCAGDGGSPLVCPIDSSGNFYELSGLVSWGIGCGNAIPGVYASVGYAHGWITYTMRNLRLNSC
ncbi:unnamed protein product [Nezara viridula]|uniref:Phenoloxidase-activating factor 2 n=1 Tax=Nezara viridula TaxID=85310 RepID=A0A9P0HAF0_NEZVI|nr:unnamed protein product [Nezara viridula]